MAVPFRTFVAEQWRNLPLLATTETCSDGTYIVTGANQGLGLQTAKQLVVLGAAKVIIAVRNSRAGEEAKAEIDASTKTHDIVEVWPLDLVSYESVKAFAKRATEELGRLDALIENAGIALDSHDKWATAEGHETSITVNVLNTMLLAVLLLPKMMKSAQRSKILPHIVIVTSEVGFTARPEFDKVKDDPFVKMNDQKTADMSQRYQLSKLIQIFAVRQLATFAPVSRTGVVVNLVNPGLCKTRLSRNASFSLWLQIGIAKMLFGRTIEMGSRTILHAAVAEKQSHGCYVSACEIKENQVPDWVTNGEGKQLQKRIWDDVVKELEAAEPGCVNTIL